MSAQTRRVIGLEEGWKELENGGIKKLKAFLESSLSRRSKDLFTNKEYTKIYTKCYDMCTTTTLFSFPFLSFTSHIQTIKTSSPPSQQQQKQQQHRYAA